MLRRLTRLLSRPKPAAARLEALADGVVTAVGGVSAQVLEVASDALAPDRGGDGKAAGRLRTAPVAPALLIATGAGVAFWYWTQWARGQAESEAAAKDEPPAA